LAYFIYPKSFVNIAGSQQVSWMLVIPLTLEYR